MTYKLYYDRWKIAEISPEDADFPGFSGRYQLSIGSTENGIIREIREYIKFSIQMSTLIDSDRTEEMDCDREQQFSQLIDSNRWYLVDRQGKRTDILVPVFGEGNTITWRLNTRQE